MIRALEPEDASMLGELLSAFFRELDPDNLLFAPGAPGTLADIYAGAPSPKITARVFQEQRSITALLLGRMEERPLRRAGRILYLDAAYTRPEYRGKGQMTALLDDLETSAKAKHLGELELATPVSNAAGLRFWRARGFRDTMTSFTRPL